MTSPTLFDTVVGHTRQVQNLKGALSGGPLASRGLLFSGPSGVGKKLLALAWAQGLLCESSGAKPCGVCSSCIRVAKTQHPDLLMIGLTEGATIKIEQIRDIQNFSSLRAYENHGKVIIINDAQAMTPQASNALLKTLEEPPPFCNFVLVTHNKSAILPTIQSRCQKILFGGLTLKEMKKVIPDAEDWALQLAQGSVSAALKLNDDEYRKLKTSALKVLRDLATTRTFDGFTSLIPLVSDRDSSLFTTQCWSRWLTLAAALALGAPVQLSAEEKPALVELNNHYSPQKLLSLGQKVVGLEHDIQANINKTLAFEKFWLDAHKLRG